MSNEVRIGILALAAIGITLWGLKYIQGSNILKSSDVYHAYYTEVGGVQIGTSVKISGVTVGSVSAVDLDLNSKQVKLDLTMNRSLPLPKSTKAVLMETGILGDKAIVLEYGQACNGADCAQNGDTFEGQYRGMVESMLGEGGPQGYINDLKKALFEISDSLNQALARPNSSSPLVKTVQDLEATMANMKNASGRFNSLLSNSGPSIEASLNNLSKLTTTLEQQRGHIAGIISNLDSLSQVVVDGHLDEALVNARAAIDNLNKTLASADTAMGGVNKIMDKVNKGEGTLGLLVQDEDLYHNLNAASASLDSLLSDFQSKPYRYMPLKGRKKVERYDKKDGNN